MSGRTESELLRGLSRQRRQRRARAHVRERYTTAM
jgi:hypothetical protein